VERTRRYFERFRIQGSIYRGLAFGVRGSAHARVSSSCVLLELI
jgi:hypothetical protein